MKLIKFVIRLKCKLSCVNLEIFTKVIQFFVNIIKMDSVSIRNKRYKH